MWREKIRQRHGEGGEEPASPGRPAAGGATGHGAAGLRTRYCILQVASSCSTRCDLQDEANQS